MTAPRAWLPTVRVVAVRILESPDASGSSCGYSETPAAPNRLVNCLQVS
jgi:hypothetical protein